MMRLVSVLWLLAALLAPAFAASPTYPYLTISGTELPNFRAAVARVKAGTTTSLFTASISGTTLTVSAVASGAVAIGQTIVGTSVPANETVTGYGTGAGNTGTYTLSATATVSSEAMTAVACTMPCARVLWIGDSGTIAINAEGAAQWPSPTDHLAAILSAAGIPAVSDGFMGWSVAGTGTGSRLGDDPRMVAGSWTSSTSLWAILGGAYLTAASGSTAFSFTPRAPVDTYNVLYSTTSGAGSFSEQIGAGSATTVNENAATALHAQSVTASPASTSPLNLTWLSGTAYVLGVEAYNSTIPSVDIINAGYYGSMSAAWTGNSNVSDPLKMLTFLKPALTIIEPGGNDYYSGTCTAIATFTANVQAMITAAQAAGSDVLLVFPPPQIATWYCSSPSLAQYQAAVAGLGQTNNVPVVDLTVRFGSYAIAAAAGLYSDAEHANTAGNADAASAVSEVLLRSAGGGPAGGLMATQPANNVAIKGGNIDGVNIGVNTSVGTIDGNYAGISQIIAWASLWAYSTFGITPATPASSTATCAAGQLGLDATYLYGCPTANTNVSIPWQAFQTGGILSGTTGSIGGSSLAAGACSTGTVSVTGAATTMSVEATPVTYPGAPYYWRGYVSSAGTVTVAVCAAVAGTPTASAYNVRVLK